MSQLLLTVAAIGGAVAVALGALAAHALRAHLEAPLLAAFQTGVNYQIYHSLALLGVAIWFRQLAPAPSWFEPVALAGLCFIAGTVAFSGSLYALALGGPRWLGPVTPVGGLVLIAGWLLLAVAAWRSG
jgi:uncharacterized membrane protein YgdD (TMEM256/DUF423 family)